MPKLNKTMIDKAEPRAERYWLLDSEVEGFRVRVYPTGRKCYFVAYRTKDGTNTQRLMQLGRCSDMPPEKARDMARKVFAQVAQGEDPLAERRPEPEPEQPAAPAPEVASVERLFEGYVANLRAKGKAMADEAERALLFAANNAADALGRHRPAAEITPADVVDYISGLYQGGHRGAADKHRAYLSAAYGWGVKSENDYTVTERKSWGLTSNPAAAVAKDAGAIGTRDRNLSAAELRRLWAGTEFEEGCGFSMETAACIRLLIACGQRVQETLRLEGADLDLAAGLWRMPAHKTKGRKHAHVIPLPYQVIPALRELVDKHGNGYLFPAQKHEVEEGAPDEPMQHQSVGHAIAKWRKRLDVNIEPFQTRDLRRTWKSRAHDAGIDRFTRDLIQQHAQSDTGSKHYDRADYLPQVTAAMSKWSAWLDVAVTGGNVTAFPSASVAA